jgi:hypothetical protein
MAMIEKGMTPPAEMTLPAGRPGETIIESIIEAMTIFTGIGLALLLGFGQARGAHGWAIGGFVALIGIAQVINSALDRRALRNSNPSSPNSNLPSM